MEENFQEIKARLVGDRVMVPYDSARETRVYSDSGPEGTQATVAQLYHHPEKGETWRPVHHSGEGVQPDREGELGTLLRENGQ